MAEEIEKLPLTSMDLKEHQLLKLKELFPEVFTEGMKVDWEKLKLTLGEDIDVGKERFGMNWPGKADCYKTIQESSIATLIPARDESIDFDTTDNLFIEGDNLEVLKLLQKSYLGKVKMIYIDPPYNTGNDFIYPDNYSENLSTYLQFTGQVDSEGKKFTTNTETDGRFHSKWMNMMYPRLFLAKNLLKEDGVIFISIDDSEVNNLRAICNEIFGEENFVSNIIWQKKFARANDATYFSTMHDHILCYAKHSINYSPDGWKINLLPRSENDDNDYINPDNDSRGTWTSVVLSSKSGSEKLKYKIITPSGRECFPPDGRYWSINKEKYEELVKDNRIWFGKDGSGSPRLKTFLSEVQSGIRPNSIWFHSEVGHNQQGRQELKKLFDDKGFFDGPKPVSLLKRILSIATTKDDLILDFFAGSATTAHAVIDLNREDDSKRKFICVQLPQLTEESSEAYKFGYKTIADISKERIRRAITEIKKSQEDKIAAKNKTLFADQQKDQQSKIDLGFKVFKLSPSNFKVWDSNVEKIPEAIQSKLELHTEHISPEATQEAILYELLLKSGFTLTTPIEQLTLAGQKVFSIAEGELLICLEDEISHDLLKAIAERKPSRVICLDKAFKGDNADALKTNAVQIMKSKGVVSFRTV